MLIFSFGTNWRTNTSQDTATVFGNTVGPLIAWGAAILTFLAFWVQYRANIEQKEQFATQDRFTKIERFENKFYSLVEIHRNNVIELKIGETTEGRKAFISLFNELKFTYLAAISCYKSN